MGGNMYLKKSDKERRFSVYVYTDTKHYVRINRLYETYIGAQKTVQELKTYGTWLYNHYSQYPYYIVVDENTRGTIQELIKKQQRKLHIR